MNTITLIGCRAFEVQTSTLVGASTRIYLDWPKLFYADGDRTPQMTSNTEPWGEVSTSWVSEDYPPYKAFDNIFNERGAAAGAGVPYWIQFDFGSGRTQRIDRYTLTCGMTPEGYQWTNPQAWTLQASNEGAFIGEEVILDTVVGQSGWTDWEMRVFDFQNPNKYRYYRLDFTESNDKNCSPVMVEIEFIDKKERIDNILNIENLTQPGISYYFPDGQFIQSVSTTNAIVEPGGWSGGTPAEGDKIKISYLIDEAVTIEYLPQEFSFNIIKKGFKEDLSEGSVSMSGLTTLRELNLSGENMTKECFDEMCDFLENDYCYVSGLEEGNLMGRFSFNASRIRGQTQIYSYNIPIEEVGKA